MTIPPSSAATSTVSLVELLDRLRQPEGDRIERKSSLADKSAIRETMVAFANSVGPDEWAVLWIGVDNDGTICGVGNPDSIKLELQKLAESHCYPPICVQLKDLDVEGKSIVACIDPSSRNPPHFAGPSYLRIGSANRRADQSQFNLPIDSRHSKAGFCKEWINQQITVHFKYSKGVPSLFFPAHNDRDYKLLDITSMDLEIQDVCAGAYERIPWDRVRLSLVVTHKRLKIEVLEP